MSLGALGVVYGDIGTSPLYALKECLGADAPHAVVPTHDNVLGVLSLITWSLILVICVKYLVFVLRADNKGEGGILALAALVSEDRTKKTKRGKVVLVFPILLGLFGTGLLFGDGVITPAISVLGAIEGLSERSSTLTYLILPITIAILVGLFLVQRHGTRRIGFAFGPVMMLWFVSIAALGIRWIVIEPRVLAAFSPTYAILFLAEHGSHGFVLIGLVFLVVTGGEALYADIGHFGKTPIRIAWFSIVLPCLLLDYFGQGALLLSHPVGSITNPFYSLAPEPLLIPLLVLATMAAVIASQALISGVFSITRQAMQLGYWPRLTVVHTSANTEGQIFVPEMNLLLMVGTIAVAVQFGSSSGLASAYGIAVTGTMGITSYLFYLVCRGRWNLSRWRSLAFLVPFLAIDLAFFSANAVKVVDGGWFPLAIGFAVFAIMTTWWRGRVELAKLVHAVVIPDEVFLADVTSSSPQRVHGTAVFMSSTPAGVPNVLMHHMKHNQVLHEQVVLLTIETKSVPYVHHDNMLEVRDLKQGIYRVLARVGFMQSPNVPEVIARCADLGIATDSMTTTYYLGRLTLLTSGKSRLAHWRKRVFAFLARNEVPPSSFFHLPPNRVVELGVQIEL